ncbi:MAG: GAF domain-containing protein [Deltaproteobacteria bacterium]|nr:GAF domain-containing protein [Deltaproteobacteria bacterium]MBZ0220118.1 GAF domain-containing protein [Deltaproteobacteria bacterium]
MHYKSDSSNRASAELEKLREELEKAREREKEFISTRRAMLSLLEDNTAIAEGIMKSKREWEATFDSILDPMLIHDSGMRVLKCNRAYQAAAGMPFNEIIGRKYYEVFPKMDGPFEACRRMLGKGEPHACTEEIRVAGPERVYNVSFYFLEKDEPTAIQIFRDVTEEKRRTERERLVYELSQDVMGSLDLEFRLKRICGTAVSFGFRMAWVGLLGPDTGEILPRTLAIAGEGGASITESALDESQDFPCAEGPSLRAVRNGTPEVQNGIPAPWKTVPGGGPVDGPGSAASFPITEAGKSIAVLTICSAKEEFPENEVPFLQTLANQAALCIRNAKLFSELKETSQKMREEMEITRHLLAIAFATEHTTDIGKLMGHVVESLLSIMEADCCLSYLWDREKSFFEPSVQKGLPPDLASLFRINPLKPDLPFVRKAMESGPHLEVLEDAAGKEALEWTGGAEAAIILPLARKSEWLGALLCLYTCPPGKYSGGLTKRDREVLGGISYQVSTALDEAKLYQDSINRALDLSRKVETISIMHEIDKSILSTLEPNEILEIAARMVSKIISCDRATVALVDREKGGFVYEAGFGLSLEKGGLIPFSDTSTTELLSTGRPQFVPDINESARLPLEEALFKEGFLSQLLVPLAIKGEVVGVLTVGARRKAAFTSDDFSVMEKLASQIGVALENARLVSDLSELFLGIVKTLSEAIDAKSPWTKGHSDRVTKYALDIAREMSFSAGELKDMELAGLLHDIGKLGTYESILDKPGRLTDEEMAVIRKHPQKGADILSPIRQMKSIVPAIKHHHESYDGSGYPEGFKEREIPLMARILAVADTVDAMSADRPYRKGLPMENIVRELKRCSGTQFDPEVVKAFLRTVARSGDSGHLTRV